MRYRPVDSTYFQIIFYISLEGKFTLAFMYRKKLLMLLYVLYLISFSYESTSSSFPLLFSPDSEGGMEWLARFISFDRKRLPLPVKRDKSTD